MKTVICILMVALLAGCATTTLNMTMTKGENSCDAHVKGSGIEFLFAKGAAKDCIKWVDEPVKAQPKAKDEDD